MKTKELNPIGEKFIIEMYKSSHSKQELFFTGVINGQLQFCHDKNKALKMNLSTLIQNYNLCESLENKDCYNFNPVELEDN